MPLPQTTGKCLPNPGQNDYSYREWIDMQGVRMAHTATLSEKFQISIPKAVREEQHWKAGQEFAFLPRDGGVMLVAVPQLEDLLGIAKGADPTGYRDREDRY